MEIVRPIPNLLALLILPTALAAIQEVHFVDRGAITSGRHPELLRARAKILRVIERGVMNGFSDLTSGRSASKEPIHLIAALR